MSENPISVDELISSAGRQLRKDFAEIQETNPHAAERGSEAEDTLKKFLKQKLPRRFDVASGIVIGGENLISRQTDVIIYDAMNSPVYRTGTRLQILPRDNVACVIEVKSKLNKDELKDAASKIADVKKIKATPICGADQPVTFSDIITTNVLGCVFAFDSYTSMETLAENLKEINKTRDASLWIDFVVVLDKGYIGYALQPMLQQDFIGWMAGTSGGDDFMIPSFYVHLVQSENGERALNFFFVRLMAHLTFFRKISAVDLMTLLRAKRHVEQTIQGYQYNLKGQLVETEVSHQSETFENPKVRFNLYHAETRKFVGQMCRFPWQDGAVITFSVLFDPSMLFRQFLARLKLKGQLLQNKCNDSLVWTSNVLPITEEKFIEIAENIHPSVISKRDSADDTPPPLTI
jgi:hypothetical protein